jgi:phosphosulfolactate phosphohydrolase-like enzyme
VVAAGYVLRALMAAATESDLSDTCLMALDVAAASPDALGALRRAAHARTLVALGFEADLAYAADLDRLDVVPERHGVRPAVFRRS